MGTVNGHSLTTNYTDIWRAGMRKCSPALGVYGGEIAITEAWRPHRLCIIRPIPVQFPEVLQGTSEA